MSVGIVQAGSLAPQSSVTGNGGADSVFEDQLQHDVQQLMAEVKPGHHLGLFLFGVRSSTPEVQADRRVLLACCNCCRNFHAHVSIDWRCTLKVWDQIFTVVCVCCTCTHPPPPLTHTSGEGETGLGGAPR